MLDGLEQDPSMRRYHLLPSVRADLLARLGRFREAQAEIARAAEMCTNERERAMLLGRASAYAWEAGRSQEPGPASPGAGARPSGA